MGSLLDNLGQLIVQYPAWKYPLIAGGMILQGELAVLVFVYLVLNQSLTWKEFILVSLTTFFLVETIIYFSGRILRRTRFGWRLYRRIKSNRRLQFYFFFLKRNITKLFIVSKFLPATNLPLFFVTGWTKTPFTQFLKNYLLSLFIWFSGMTLIAYSLVSGLYYLKVEKIFRQVELGIVIVVLLIFGMEYIIKKVLKKAIAIQEKASAIGKMIEEEIKNPPNESN